MSMPGAPLKRGMLDERWESLLPDPVNERESMRSKQAVQGANDASARAGSDARSGEAATYYQIANAPDMSTTQSVASIHSRRSDRDLRSRCREPRAGAGSMKAEPANSFGCADVGRNAELENSLGRSSLGSDSQV